MIAGHISIVCACMKAREESIGNIKMKLNAVMPSSSDDDE
jgi:hypothetical protein